MGRPFPFLVALFHTRPARGRGGGFCRPGFLLAVPPPALGFGFVSSGSLFLSLVDANIGRQVLLFRVRPVAAASGARRLNHAAV
jgi:hypothetical protein